MITVAPDAANPLQVALGFDPVIAGPVTVAWHYGDGRKGNTAGPTTTIYPGEGVFFVSASIRSGADRLHLGRDVVVGGIVPAITGLAPNTAVAGAVDDVTMVVTGTGFDPESTIVFNGFDEPTTRISATEVSTVVQPSLFVVPAVCPVEMRNPDGNVSNSVDFTFTAT